MQRDGLVVAVGGQTWSVPIRCSDLAGDLGPQDLVLVTLKAPTIPAATEELRKLIGENTTIAFMLNGIPWWYYYRHGGQRDGLQLPALDPNGIIWRTIGPQRVLGAVAYCSSIIDASGTIRLDYPNVHFEFGEPDGSNSERLARTLAAMKAAGLNTVSSEAIRERIWAKLILNMVSGPSTVLTLSPLRDVVTAPGMTDKVRTMWKEAIAIAGAAGVTLAPDIERVIAKFSASAHRPSILQDLEAGRPMEIDALYGVPLEIGKAAGVQAPMLELLTTLVKIRARHDGLY
jgi:2-dehydropantoate 2-reductase